MKHAVFIEPDGDVLRLVTEWKQRVSSRWPEAVYLSHPAHATVWVGEVTDAIGAANAVQDALRSMSRETVTLSGPHVFYDDVPAGGGQTVCFAAERTSSVMALQDAVSRAIAPFVRAPYPFAGPHWMPHFTVASLPVRRDDRVITEFLGSAGAGLTTPCRLGWWAIDGERHERVSSL